MRRRREEEDKDEVNENKDEEEGDRIQQQTKTIYESVIKQVTGKESEGRKHVNRRTGRRR